MTKPNSHFKKQPRPDEISRFRPEDILEVSSGATTGGMKGSKGYVGGGVMGEANRKAAKMNKGGYYKDSVQK